MEQYLHYFCGDANDPNALTDTEPLRISFYKAVVTFLRAYADIAQNLAEAGYSDAEIAALEKEMEFLQRHPRRHQKALGRGAGHQALRGGHAPPHQHLHPGRPRRRSGQPEFAVAHGADHRDRHPRCHCPQAERERASSRRMPSPRASSTTSARRSSATSSPTRDSTRRCPSCSTISSNRSAGRRSRYEEFLKKAEDLVKTAGEERAHRGIPAIASRQARSHRALQQPGEHPGDDFPVSPADGATQHPRLSARTRRREGALALEIDLAMREQAPAGWKGDETARSRCSTRCFPSCRGTAQRRRRSLRSSRTSRATDDGDDPAR